MVSASHWRQFLQHIVPAVMRPLRILWNQIIGFVFLVLALWAAPRTIHSIRNFEGDLESLFRLLLSSTFILLMGGFGIYSFWRARKASK
jgi:hypothetical protein